MHTLETQVLPSAQSLLPRGEWILQEGSDPKHTSSLCQELLTYRDVSRLSWPAQSPDPSPIENLWSTLDERLKNRTCSTKDQQFACLQEACQLTYLQSCAVVGRPGTSHTKL